MNGLPVVVIPCAGLFAALFATAAAAGGNVEAGRRLAEHHCARCHVISPDINPYGGINSTPSFPLLARRDDWLERFQTFYERRPHPVFVRIPDVPRWTKLPSHVKEFTIQPTDIDDIIAFVEALRAQKKNKSQ
ncbi:MAG: hypothetical protein D6826_09115 [Alphaproteobacteria bacterium]|nr:MAG: hypothetical protein D6826_09115 [Alphaproteobacteria bacterium]